MFWDCVGLGGYWKEVVELLNHITERTLTPDMGLCLLLWFPHTARMKITSKFIDLGLILAKREITMYWKSVKGASVVRWRAGFLRWARSEGTLRLQQARRSNNDKALEAAWAWEALVVSLQSPNLELEEESDPDVEPD